MLQQAGQSPVILPIAVVFWFTLSAGLVAGFIYALIAIFTSNPKPIFWAVSALVFILFFFGPITSAVGLTAILALELMHVGAAVPIIFSIFRAAHI